MAHIPRSLGNVAENIRVCSSTKAPVSLAYDTFGSLNAARSNMLVMICGLNGNKMAYYTELCEKLATPGAFTSALYGVTQSDFECRSDDVETAVGPPVGSYEQAGQDGFFVVRFDNRDTGDSTKFSTHGDPNYLKAFTVPAWIGGGVEPVYSLDDMAADAASLVPHLGAQRAHFMGSSMGGMITQLVAINHPDRVWSISSCVSSTGAKDVKDATLWSKSWFLFGPATPADEDVIANKVKWYEGVGCSPASLTERGKAFNHATVRRQVKHSSYVAGIGRQIMAIMTAPSRDEKLKNVTCPALVYHGMQDVVVPYERGIRTAEMLPDATFVVEPRMGHTVMPEFYPRLVELMGVVARKGVALAAARNQ